jgi:hypothetical protein
MLKADCVNVEKCLRYLEMTLDPESEILRCKDCPAYRKTAGKHARRRIKL